MFDSFPVLESLLISENRRLRIIHPDAYSNSKHLCYLDLSNNRISSICEKHIINYTSLMFDFVFMIDVFNNF